MKNLLMMGGGVILALVFMGCPSPLNQQKLTEQKLTEQELTAREAEDAVKEAIDFPDAVQAFQPYLEAFNLAIDAFRVTGNIQDLMSAFDIFKPHYDAFKETTTIDEDVNTEVNTEVGEEKPRRRKRSPEEMELKATLMELNPDVPDFTVNIEYEEPECVKDVGCYLGFYFPETKDIVLYVLGFNTEDRLMFAAIHEFAHHVHSTDNVLPKKGEDGYDNYDWHNDNYQAIMDELLSVAKEKGLYNGEWKTNGGVVDL